MNISQAPQIYHLLKTLPEDAAFWDKHYTKEMCFEGNLPAEEWYAREKQNHWQRWRKQIIEDILEGRG